MIKKFSILLILITFLFVGCASGIFTTANIYMDRDSTYSEDVSRTISNTNSEFSFVVIPDTQGYTDYYSQTPRGPIDFADIYYEQMQYVADNAVKNGGPFSFAIHMGDFVCNQGFSGLEWKIADKAMSLIDGVMPWGCVPGNHDYDFILPRDKFTSTSIYGSNKYDKYFGPKSKHFKDKEWYGGSSENGRNSWSIFKGGDQDFLFIGLEIQPSDKSLEWAQQVIEEHKGMPTILTIHEYIVAMAQTTPDRPQAPYAGEGGGYRPEKDNSPSEVWDNFIRKNSQIFLVLCGHAFGGEYGEASRIDINDDGYKVWSILSNYQGRRDYLPYKQIPYEGELRECGDGWLRILTLNMEKQTIHVQTYSTAFDLFETDFDSDFIADYEGEDWNKRFNLIK